MNRPRIAVTMGDPAGIGPELCLRLLRESDQVPECVPIVVGDAAILRRLAWQLGWPAPELVLDRSAWSDQRAALDRPAVVDLGLLAEDAVQPGQVLAACGRAAYGYIEWAIQETLAGRFDAISTAPIHKEALHAAGIRHPGHTEILAELTGTPHPVMMLTAPEITCSLVTTHVGLHEVPRLLTRESILHVIEVSAAAMERMRGHAPHITVCGLNPHAGEHGLFGQGEEERLIAPAIAVARARGHRVSDPVPPDTAFLPARRRTTDCYVCMYHDQGLIPLKALAFDQGVNVTLGLPIVRTSVDHGTAFGIAWQGVADPSSLYESLRLAARLARQAAPVDAAPADA